MYIKIDEEWVEIFKYLKKDAKDKNMTGLEILTAWNLGLLYVEKAKSSENKYNDE